MAITLNGYLKIKQTPEGKRLFGKCGYQTLHPKVDKFTKANMATIERALDEGKLTDIDGNPVTDGKGAVIVCYYRVDKVTSAADMEHVDELTGINGVAIEVEAPVAAEGDNPF